MKNVQQLKTRSKHLNLNVCDRNFFCVCLNFITYRHTVGRCQLLNTKTMISSSNGHLCYSNGNLLYCMNSLRCLSFVVVHLVFFSFSTSGEFMACAPIELGQNLDVWLVSCACKYYLVSHNLVWKYARAEKSAERVNESPLRSQEVATAFEKKVKTHLLCDLCLHDSELTLYHTECINKITVTCLKKAFDKWETDRKAWEEEMNNSNNQKKVFYVANVCCFAYMATACSHRFCVHWVEADSGWAAGTVPPSHGWPPHSGDWEPVELTSHSPPLLQAAPGKPGAPSCDWRGMGRASKWSMSHRPFMLWLRNT